MWHQNTTKLLVLLFIQCYGEALAQPASSLGNSTSNTTEAGGTQLYCEKTTWYDVCWFFFTNYLLHALSVRSLPGENAYSSTVFKLCCLLVPYTGVRRGLSLISRASSLIRDDLQAAARAGALCMVVRKPDWRPENGQVVHGCGIRDAVEEQTSERTRTSIDEEKTCSCQASDIEKFGSRACDCNKGRSNRNEVALHVTDPDEAPAPSRLLDKLSRLLILTDRFNTDMPSTSPVDHKSIKIHGMCKLAPGYGLSYLSPNIKVYARHNTQVGEQVIKSTRLASTHDIPRILFSLIQTISGGYSLYKARGSQIDRYGFAAFGLTVIPYMIVSIINFIGSLLGAEYETVYMVHSKTMDEMISRGGLVDGIVGSLQDNPTIETAPPGSSEGLSENTTSILFEGYTDQLHGYEAGIEKEKERNFSILPYEPPKPPKPPPTKRWIVRFCQRYRKWHGLVNMCATKQNLKPSGPAIVVPSHFSIQRLPPPYYQDYLNVLAILMLSLTLALPYIVIGFLTGWRANQSTSVQRNFALSWLIAGQAQGYVVAKVEMITGRKSSIRGLIIIFIAYGSNCLCGLTMVAQEMIEFGTCKAM